MVPKEGGEDFSPVEITYNVTCKMIIMMQHDLNIFHVLRKRLTLSNSTNMLEKLCVFTVQLYDSQSL